MNYAYRIWNFTSNCFRLTVTFHWAQMIELIGRQLQLKLVSSQTTLGVYNTKKSFVNLLLKTIILNVVF